MSDKQQTIIIEITADGEIKAGVHGVCGPDCSKLSKFLDNLGKVERDEKTNEFYKPAERMVSVKR